MKLCYCNNFTNFGDALAPRLIKHLMHCNVEYADVYHADMMSVGSLFYTGDAFYGESARFPDRAWFVWAKRKAFRIFKRPIDVWGSGFLRQPKIPRLVDRYVDLNVKAIRGRQTLDVLRKVGYSIPDKVALGDPGLFYPELVPGLGEVEKEYDLAIVPGHAALEDGVRLLAAVREMGVSVRIVDVMQDDPLQTIKEIASARRIVASAMHAMIVADALGIPNRLMDFRYHNPWKINDYYSAYGLCAPEALCLDACVHNPEILFKAIPERPYVTRDAVDKVKEGLLNAL